METKRLRIIFLSLTVFIVALGGFFIWYIWSNSLARTSAQAIILAKTSEIALNGEMLKQLKAVPEDVGTLAYESIKNRLVNLPKINKDIRFVYIYTLKGDKLYFLADSELVDSEDYSPPGQEYTEADPQYYKPFKSGEVLITDPVTDSWGRWISVLVPMIDPETGEIQKVFGTDYPANLWEMEALIRVIMVIIAIFFVLSLFVFFFLLAQKNIKLRDIENKVEEKTKEAEKSEIDIKKTLDESEKLNKLMVGRELEMIRLKKEIAELKENKTKV